MRKGASDVENYYFIQGKNKFYLYLEGSGSHVEVEKEY